MASHRVGDLAVVASGVDGVPRATPKTLALHHGVLETTMDADAVVPFRVGTVVESEGLEARAAAHALLLRTTLDRVRGCVEMSVKLLRLDVARAGDAAIRPLADCLLDRAGVDHWRFLTSGSVGNVVASVAFLVPRGEVATFLARIAPVASRAVGIAVVPTGPWPAYSFVPAFDPAPLARMPASRGLAGALPSLAG